MDRTRLHIYYISLSGMYHVKSFGYRSVVTTVVKFLSRHLAVEARIYLRIGTCLKHIPYLVLAEGIIPFRSYLIVRMDLYGKLALYIEELHQQRELPSIIIIYILPHDTFEICLHDLAYGVARKPAVSRHRIFEAHVGDLPALSYLLVGTYEYFVSFLVTLGKGFSKLGYKCISAPRSP